VQHDTATNDPPKWRVAGRPSASKITKSSVLYQHLKGKAHDINIEFFEIDSCT
jgi:hypothetical protein